MDAVTLQAVGTRLLPGAQLLRTKQTFFSDLGIFSLNGSGCKVVKHLLPALANGHTDLPRLMTATQAFMTELNTLGITTPSTQLAQCNEGVFMISDFVGPDLQEYLSCQDNPTEIRRIFVKMIHLLQGALLQNQEYPIVGLDLQLANFGSQNGLTYLDPFPPLIRMEDELWVHYPQPTSSEGFEAEIERKFRRLGTLRRLRGDIMKLNPAYDALLDEALMEVLGPIGHEVVQWFETLPDRTILQIPVTKAVELISSLGPQDKDLLRELSARLIPMDGNRKAYMHRMFCLSRKDPSPGYEQSHNKRVEILKTWLITLLGEHNNS